MHSGDVQSTMKLNMNMSLATCSHPSARGNVKIVYIRSIVTRISLVNMKLVLYREHGSAESRQSLKSVVPATGVGEDGRLSSTREELISDIPPATQPEPVLATSLCEDGRLSTAGDEFVEVYANIAEVGE